VLKDTSSLSKIPLATEKPTSFVRTIDEEPEEQEKDEK